jgi:hypothetical protein
MPAEITISFGPSIRGISKIPSKKAVSSSDTLNPSSTR